MGTNRDTLQENEFIRVPRNILLAEDDEQERKFLTDFLRARALKF